MIQEVENIICEHFGIDNEVVRSNKTTKDVCLVRSIIWYILYNSFGYSAKKLSDEYGRTIRNIRYSIANTRFLIEKDKEFQAIYKNVKSLIKK